MLDFADWANFQLQGMLKRMSVLIKKKQEDEVATADDNHTKRIRND